MITGLIAFWFADLVMPDIKYALCKAEIWYRLDKFNIKQLRRLKPFDCAICLGFWLGFFTSLSLPFSQMIINGVVSSLVAYGLSKLNSNL